MMNFDPCNVCKLDTAISIIFSDIIVVWMIAILLFTYLSNVYQTNENYIRSSGVML